ncbi:hypothetical protein I5G81_gp74 [Mycobacterium phage Shandong1]|uniref:Helix-turn-helix DNA binding domain protein n=1 Tax=Mycobacterium phage Shandong1 TaxID=1983447 RepID=A0A1X9SHA1_9CAUD|nr:hypothetical protein I5G81_gp74 [Mycobacterium phage Shandong1]ARQ95513.1 hypothetical protein [Mycobacterium phage Shandong1]
MSLPDIADSADSGSSRGVLESLAGVSYYGSPRPSAPSELDVDTTPTGLEPDGKCGNCSAETTAPICWPCAKLLGRVLADVPWLLRRLHESAYGEAKVAKRGLRVSTGERLPSLPLNARAADLLRDAARLVLWVEQVDGVMRGAALDASAAEHAARALGAQIGAAMMHPYAPDALRWALQWRGDAERVIDLPPDTTYAGPCQAPGVEQIVDYAGDVVRTVPSGKPCGASLYVDAEALAVECWRCGESWRVEDLQRQALERVDDRPRTAADMWRLFKFLGRDVPRSSFYALMTTVEAAGYNAAGLPVYAYTAVAAALDARDAAEAERKAAGKAKRGRPRKAASVDTPTPSVDGSTGAVLPSRPSVSDTG